MNKCPKRLSVVKKEPRVLLVETEFALLLLGVQFIYITNFSRLEILELTSLSLPDRINRRAKIHPEYGWKHPRD